MTQIRQRNVKQDHTLPDDLHPVLQRILAARDVTCAADMDYSLEKLLSYKTLKDIAAAVALLQQAIQGNKSILIVADYDADGATACALAIRGLSAMGAANVSYLVPDRAKHGYGLSVDVVRLALDLDPDLIVTVDNGISSIEGVAYARQAGVDVLITDHHLPGEVLPEATVIINPNQPGDEFPDKHLAGVGVMFYVLLALRAGLREQGRFDDDKSPQPNLAALLDIVALGTVADVVKLDYNNRILVSRGLERIRNRRCCAGILALLQVARRAPETITATDLGFVLGPRLNAAGRLQDMGVGIECLLSDDVAEARRLATELDKLNRERKTIQAGMQAKADDYMQTVRQQSTDELPAGICLHDNNWHQGVIGILASRIKEGCNRPVFVFAPGDDGDLKGSGRSVTGIHLKDVLEALARQSPGLMLKFGGHAMAAGLTIKQDHYTEFCQRFDAEVKRLTAGLPAADEIVTDGELAKEDFSLELAQAIAAAGPWGQGFPEPCFSGHFTVAESRVVGEKHLRLKLRPETNKRQLDAIAFNTPPEAIAGKDSLQLVYQLVVNKYQGRQSVELLVKRIEAG
ncbi:MAG: single-stranded-DNA-specific exonuclease RecJ [Gammaproteobacteria bacterium]